MTAGRTGRRCAAGPSEERRQDGPLPAGELSRRRHACFRLPVAVVRLGLALVAASLAAGSAAAQATDERHAAGSLALLRASAETYATQRDCFSCHHQALPLWAHAAAGPPHAEAGFLRSQAEFTASWFAVRRASVRRGHGVPGGPYTAGYAILGLTAAGMADDPAADDLVAYLLATQEQDGRWSIRTHRPPLEDSDFTSTALAVRGLRLAAPLSAAADVDERIARASRWLAAQTAHSGEDRAYRLLGLAWCEADTAHLADAAAAILSNQRDDGGWAQIDDLPSDAYATGQALAALWLSGCVSPAHPAYQRGLAWLQRRRLADGSWHVVSRSRPFQEYFESGFPHGSDQFISVAATSWAVLAMLPDRPPTPSLLETAQRLPHLLTQRLTLMREVAQWKWLHRRPISDPEREQALLWTFGRQAAQSGIEPHRARSFLRGQMAAARLVQQAWFERWESAPEQVPRHAPDLERELRPRLDQLTAELSACLAAWDRLDVPSQHAALAGASAHAAALELPPQALATALAPLAPRAAGCCTTKLPPTR